MNVLIVGSGGREHAIATMVAKSHHLTKLYCAPGNGGIGQIGECVDIQAMDFENILSFVKEKAIDLTIVGMDAPLVGGLVDELEREGFNAFGPRKNAAILEGSKVFSKELMKKYGIPTAAYENFDDPEKAVGVPGRPKDTPDTEKADPDKKADDSEKADEKGERCICSTDQVDREIEKLKEKKGDLEKKLNTETDEKKVDDLQRQLEQVARELLEKDNDSYRKQHATFTRL